MGSSLCQEAARGIETTYLRSYGGRFGSQPGRPHGEAEASKKSTLLDMGVNPKIGILPPKWMVKIMENPIKMDDLGVKTLFLETPMF